MKQVTKIGIKTTEFYYKNRLFEVTPSKRRIVWTLHKRFGSAVRYRILHDVDQQRVPVAVQRQKVS